MRILLDTHTFIWLSGKSTQLSAEAAKLIADPNNTLLLSLASMWEIQIKMGIGKLTLPKPLPDAIQELVLHNRLRLMPIELIHIYALATLPDHHRDPFDRLLIAQAVSENLPILTSDPLIARYPILTVW